MVGYPQHLKQDRRAMSFSIQECLLRIEKRAERVEEEKLTETFVDAAPLLASVSTKDHQIIFGRRGTGKTHILRLLQDQSQGQGDISLYLDLRSIGSNGSIYNDQQKTHAQRATPLLLDVLIALQDALLEVAVGQAETYDLSKVGPKLDDLADAISTVEVVGSYEHSVEKSVSSGTMAGYDAGLTFTDEVPGFSLKTTGQHQDSSSEKVAERRSGIRSYYVRFGSVQTKLKAVLEALGNRQVWLLLDEWSEVPLDLQPYLADLLRRCVVPLSGMTLKIAAIEHRSNFILRHAGGYLGLELGADAGGDVNLDDFMVFDNDASRSTKFFADLLFKHYRATDGLDPNRGPQTPGEFVGELFTQITAFEEFVRAVEGVPRDAVYLAGSLARRAFNRSVSVQDVRASARDWYQRDKTTVLKANPTLSDLLHWIIEEVIAHRRARAFLLPSNQKDQTIELLFDSRLLHVRKKNIASNDSPGIRYDVYKLDYGCYVDLITSSKAPGGLLPSDVDGGFVDVPPDDYRSIRRAILDLSTFKANIAGKREKPEAIG